MSDRLEHLERRVDDLASRFDHLVQEVVALRNGSPRPDVPEDKEPSRAPASPEEDWAISRDFEALVARHGLVILAGLVSLVLAGGLILRAVAMSDLVPLEAGAAIGLCYCGSLALVANRKLRRDATLYGDTFAVLSVLMLVALLVEVAHRPDGLSPVSALAVLGGGLVVLAVILLRRSRPAPFVVLLLATPVAGVAIGGRPFPHAWFAGVLCLTLLAAQVATVWRGWGRTRWGPGLMSLAYLFALGQIARANALHDLPHHVYARPLPALTILAGLFALHVAPALRATLLRTRPLDAYEITMAVVASLLGYVGAVGVLANMAGGGALVAGWTGVGLAAMFYGAAFLGFVRQGAESRNFYALGAIGFLLALGALPVLLGGVPALGAAYQALGLGLAILAARLGKKSLSFQAHVLAVAAFLVLAATAVRLSPPEAPGPGDGGWLLLAGVMGIGAFARLRSFVPPGEAFTLRRLRLRATALVLVLAAAGVELVTGAVDLLEPPAAAMLGVTDGGGRAALWHTILTLVLTVAAVGTLATGARLRLGGVTVLAAALMGVAGLKLFLVDSLRVPVTHMVASAAAFGVALILSSVLYRRSRGLGMSGRENNHAPSATT